ncbi:MAG: peptidase S41, partial [Saprospiraceae bacterium]
MTRLFIFFFGLISTSLMAQTNAYFLSNPCLTPDGQTVIFSFEGDLWKADVKDGIATRLTAMQGYETSPKVSPDGLWLAFTGRQYGNGDIYLMSMRGGEIKQITFHSSNDELTSWSWDSKYMYFNSGRMGQVAGYKIGLEGGTPVRLFGDYFFQYDHNLIEHPSSGELFFSDTWESSNQAARKRYKGPFNPEIQSYNLKTKIYKKYTTWEGKDFGTTLDRKGNIYFISDQLKGEYNLYSFDHSTKKTLTEFTTSIKSPQVNADGGKIVFEKDYQLWLYDIRSNKANKLNISILRNNTLPKEKDFDVKGNIAAYDVSPDGKKLVMVSRGELFVSDLYGKFIQQIQRHTSERVREVKWLSNNKTILFNQTFEGYTNWFTIQA